MSLKNVEIALLLSYSYLYFIDRNGNKFDAKEIQ